MRFGFEAPHRDPSSIVGNINKNSREEVNFFPTFFVHIEINTYLCGSIKT